MKKGHDQMIIGPIYQEDTVIINWIAPNNKAPKYIKQKSSLWSLIAWYINWYTCIIYLGIKIFYSQQKLLLQ